MSAERVAFAKIRARLRRELEAVQASEHEGGELNLVPYLDIVTNVVMFLLATTVSVALLANLNVAAPRYADPSTVAASANADEPEKKLNLTVTVSYSGFIIAGSNAVLPGPDGKGGPTIACRAALTGKRCPAYLSSRINRQGESEPFWVDMYDYSKLRVKIQEIKEHYPDDRQVIILADRDIPYQVIVHAMDTVRGTSTTKCKGTDGCFFDQIILSAGVS